MREAPLTEIESGYARLLENVRAWAEQEPEIRAVVLIGSRARTDHPADEWSDLDLLVFSTNPNRFTQSAGWLQSIGHPLLTFCERTPTGDWERRALFEGGLDVDFALLPAGALDYLANNDLPVDAADAFRRGAHIVVDKDGLAAQIRQRPISALVNAPPAESEFENLVHDFWYHALWTAKHLRRGELWWAKGGCDMHLKELLRRMMQWHATAMNGPGFDTWMRGRFLEEWADPRAVAALPDIFAHYDEADIARALLATMNLFHWLAIETAELLGYKYPAEGERAVVKMVREMLVGEGNGSGEL